MTKPYDPQLAPLLTRRCEFLESLFEVMESDGLQCDEMNLALADLMGALNEVATEHPLVYRAAMGMVKRL